MGKTYESAERTHPTRLNRPQSAFFGTDQYAYEELVAEMCSCFMGTELKMEAISEHIDNHLAIFVSRLWQIHIFGEGNTRTTAVFFIKYLRTLGFDATNDIFAENAWYFRNALVRANYNDLKNGIHETTEYLEVFLRNLLLDERNELHNRSMHISGSFNIKVDIESKKVDIRNKIMSFSDRISEKTINHTINIFVECGTKEYFGRTVIEEITGLKASGASKLIKLLLDSNIIIPVSGHGKGKYRFL